MKHYIRNICGILSAVTFARGAVSAHAEAVPNPRNVSNSNSARATTRSGAETSARAATARNTTKSVARIGARGAIVSNAMRGAAAKVRTANTPNVSRTAVSRNTTASTVKSDSNTYSRSALPRATAVFNDVSKIGSGYAACREAYATCMDQFCANANDTYRRCYCSSRFADFRETETALDQAKTLLMQFEDNNLNAVDKTASEVNAMYSATVGELAVKKDTSGAAQLLDQIGDLLSGKATRVNTNTFNSLGVLSLDISSDIDDIWGNNDNSIFSQSGEQNLAEMEGVDLYNASNKQCVAMISDACQSSAVLQMARSSYNIMIIQDCNTYEKKLESKKESVKQTVRTAEKYLREARLEEYRAHNSADVNECIARVKTAITSDSACGSEYKRCLDYTGVYINQSTGEPIYSPRLFQLNELITLAGTDSRVDVLRQNQQFDKFLDSKRMYAAGALDTCRDIADTVWDEFKRSALIEIAQAQDEKIESVKMSCVSTISDCYDTQSDALKSFDDSTAQASGAVSARAARELCADKVIACASLYGDTTGCTFDGNGKIINGNDGTNGRCGLNALLSFVDAVDTVRINEGCETALQNYANELCTPATSMFPTVTSVQTSEYPWGCFRAGSDRLNTLMQSRAKLYCDNGIIDEQTYTQIAKEVTNSIQNQIETMNIQLCDALGGLWISGTSVAYSGVNALPEYYSLLDNTIPTINRSSNTKYCVNELQYKCLDYSNGNSVYLAGQRVSATYQSITNTCTITFPDSSYSSTCTNLGGTMSNNICSITE